MAGKIHLVSCKLEESSAPFGQRRLGNRQRHETKSSSALKMVLEVFDRETHTSEKNDLGKIWEICS